LSTPLTRALNTFANNVRRSAHTEEIPWEADICYAFYKASRMGSAILAIVYLFDISAELFPNRSDFSTSFKAVSKTAWIAYVLALLKKWALGVNDRDHNKNIGITIIYDRLSDVALALVAFAVSVDLLPGDLRKVGQSVLAFTGGTSFIFALALREPLSQIASAIQLTALSDKFQVGEEIHVVSADIVGVVMSMDWFATSVQKPDESIALIPNVRQHRFIIPTFSYVCSP